MKRRRKTMRRILRIRSFYFTVIMQSNRAPAVLVLTALAVFIFFMYCPECLEELFQEGTAAPVIEMPWPNASILAKLPLMNKLRNESLCNVREPVLAIDRLQVQHYPRKRWRHLRLPIISMKGCGRFGNLMGEYATLYALGRAYNVTVRLSTVHRQELQKYFPKLSIPVLREIGWWKWKSIAYPKNHVYTDMEAAAAGLLGPHLFMTDGYPFEIQLFHAYACEIQREFTFSVNIQIKVFMFWARKKLAMNDTVYVGVHIRRTDYREYLEEMGSTLPDNLYYERAMEYFVEKFPKVMFIIASDDMKYVKETFTGRNDVTFVPGTDREEDMAILTFCNHSIITVGSFGFWAGYLAGGMVLYPKYINITNYPFQRSRYEKSHLDNFIPIDIS